MALEDKIDSLICAIHMLVGQMQAEKLVKLRWKMWRNYVDKYIDDSPEAKRLAALAEDAERRAAGLGRM